MFTMNSLLILLATIHLTLSTSSLYYQLESQNEDSYNREKRDTANDSLTWKPETPADYEMDDKENDEDSHTTEHTYYNMTIISDEAAIDKYYVNMTEWTNNKNATVNSTHDHLQNAYRKAAGIKLKFEFPFYGHKLVNVTIATGGFLYVGDQAHSWLAATQYIAPLMANFDTLSNSSLIIYGDDEKRFVVEWQNVKLRDDPDAGTFTFQASLFANGDIWFVYKDVPISVNNISDAYHPRKLGVSDAYLFTHRMKSPSDPTQTTSKKVIHEYHRITIPREDVQPNTVIILKALPTCLQYQDCGACSNSTLKFFQCTWCATGPDTEAFCSDVDGLHRRRQEFVEGYCNRPKKDMCDVSTPRPVVRPTATDSNSHPDAVQSLTTDATKPNKKADTSDFHPETKTLTYGKTFFYLLVIFFIIFSAWMYYAYNNPYSWSGQQLIKYRPSKWRSPANQVRYSASGHM